MPHVMAAKAVALTEANSAEFAAYAAQIRANADALAAACIEEGLTVTTGGTDNHLMLIDVTGFGITGRQAESALRECGITLNRNVLPPFDTNGPWYTSGLRIGTPAVTTLGMVENQMREIAAVIRLVLAHIEPTTIEKGENKGKPKKANYILDADAKLEALARVRTLLGEYPVYPELDLALLKRHFG